MKLDTARSGLTPPGPTAKYDTSGDLLQWMKDQFECFGNIFKASVYGTNAFVVNDPRYVEHVLRINWRNYKKGQAIKRIGLLLGKGLMVIEGEFWKNQRRMIQPAFHDKAMSSLINTISAANEELLTKWAGSSAAKKNREYHARHRSSGPENCACRHLQRRLRPGCTTFQYPRR